LTTYGVDAAYQHHIAAHLIYLESVLLAHVYVQIALASEQRLANLAFELRRGLGVLLHDVHLQKRQIGVKQKAYLSASGHASYAT